MANVYAALVVLLLASPALAQQEAPIMTLVPDAPPPAYLRLEVTVDLHLTPAVAAPAPAPAPPPAAAPQPERTPRREREDRTWLRAIIAGAVTFVVGYALPAMVRLDLSVPSNDAQRFIPVLGAFLAAAETADDPLRIGYAFAGIAQIAGLATLIGGLATIPIDPPDGDALAVDLEFGPTELRLTGTF